MMLYLKMVLASSRFSAFLESFWISASSSEFWFYEDLFIIYALKLAVKITTCFAFIIFTLSYDFSINGLP